MRNFLQNLSYKMQMWMQGRYGYDELSRAMSITALVCMLVSLIPKLQFLYIPALVLVMWSIIRCYSKKLEQRRTERDAWLRFAGRIRSWFSLQKRKWTDRKTHRYYRCKQCKTTLRVPKGKGRIEISCPKCRGVIVKTT